MAPHPAELSENALVAFARDLIAIPNENPPGAAYDECVARIGAELEALALDYELVDTGDDETRRQAILAKAEGEHVRLDARRVEGDLEGALFRGCGLADELVEAVDVEDPVAVAVEIDATRGGGWLAVQRDAEVNRSRAVRSPQDEVNVSCVEAEQDVADGIVQDDAVCSYPRVRRSRALLSVDGVNQHGGSQWQPRMETAAGSRWY